MRGCAFASVLMLMRQYGHQWPRWNVTTAGPSRQQILQADQPAVLVRQHERRHLVAGLGRGLAGVVFLQAGDQAIDDGGDGWMQLARRVGKYVEPLAHRAVEVARLFERLAKIFNGEPGGHVVIRTSRAPTVGARDIS